MIPDFPKFKKLTFGDKDEIEFIVNKFPPYSDYNFVSMWSYNTDDSLMLSKLNGNLVVRFRDYISNKPFFSFVGNIKSIETIDTLLSYAQNNGVPPVLKLIPEASITNIHMVEKEFNIQKDENNHDYILSVPQLTTFAGNKFGAKRNFVNRFKKLYPHFIVKNVDLSDRGTANSVLRVFDVWGKRKNGKRSDTITELTAIKRLLHKAGYLNLVTLAIFNKDVMIGFSINEILHDHFAIIHFEKADTQYTGIFQFLKQHTAIQLGKSGVQFINYEQDLGIEGLKKAKKSYHPIYHLNKYTISLLQSDSSNTDKNKSNP